MSTTTEQLEASLETEKALLRETISELGDRAQTVVDWKHHYRQHTVLALGAAALVGVVAGLNGPRGARRLTAKAAEVVPRAASSVTPAIKHSLSSMSAMVVGRLLGIAEDAVRDWTRQIVDGRPTGERRTGEPRREPDVVH